GSGRAADAASAAAESRLELRIQGSRVRYYVTIRGATYAVDVEGGRVVVDGTPLEAHLAAVPGTPLQHLLLAGDSWTVAAQPLEGAVPFRLALGVVGERFEVEVVDERTRQIQALTGAPRGSAGSGTIRAPMPGVVGRVEVAAGQRVDAGAGVGVGEAAKTERGGGAKRAGGGA